MIWIVVDIEFSSSHASLSFDVPQNFRSITSYFLGKPLEIELGIFIESFGSVDIAKMVCLIPFLPTFISKSGVH